MTRPHRLSIASGNPCLTLNRIWWIPGQDATDRRGQPQITQMVRVRTEQNSETRNQNSEPRSGRDNRQGRQERQVQESDSAEVRVQRPEFRGQDADGITATSIRAVRQRMTRPGPMKRTDIFRFCFVSCPSWLPLPAPRLREEEPPGRPAAQAVG